MYGIDLSVQFENLMPALGLGFILGLLYDILRLSCIVFHKKQTVVFAVDVIFIVMCTGISYLLYIALNNGHVRLYLLIAQTLGGVIYRFTAGELIFSFFMKIIKAAEKLILTVFAPVKVFAGKISEILRKMVRKIYINFKKIKNKFKKALKDDEQLLYNSDN